VTGIVDVPDYVRDHNGDVLLRDYTIPYRPQYVLTFGINCEFGPGGKGLPCGPWDQDHPGFRFHLSDDALKLIAAQGADPKRGFTRINVVWDATDAGPPLLTATQCVTQDQVRSAKDEQLLSGRKQL